MSKTILVIVESPGKIEKIQHILGDNYIVKASYGHIIDLNKKTMSIDFNTYQPQYNINDEKKQKLVSNLIKEYNKVDDVLLATDEDREGEMIAWSLAKELNIKYQLIGRCCRNDKYHKTAYGFIWKYNKNI